MPKFTQISPDAFEKIPINAGVLLSEFLSYDESGALSKTPDSSTFNKENIIGVTSGGISFASNPNMIDFGEDMDNVPANTWQLKRCTSYNPTISGTFVTIDNEMGKMLIGAAEATKLTAKQASTATEKTNIYRIRPTLDMKDAFHNLWLICDYTTDNGDNGGYVALHIKNALSTGGLQWQTSKDAKGQFSFEFTGHYDLRNIDEQPFDFYIKEPDTAGDV